MAIYRLKYGEPGENVVTETLKDVEVEREDGWVVIFRGREAILRVLEPHVLSLEKIGETS